MAKATLCVTGWNHCVKCGTIWAGELLIDYNDEKDLGLAPLSSQRVCDLDGKVITVLPCPFCYGGHVEFTQKR